MGHLRNGAAGPGGDAGRTVPLPNLTDVDLRTLRAMDDPELIAVVERTLAEAGGLRKVWYTTGDSDDRPRGHAFSAALGEPVRGEDAGG